MVDRELLSPASQAWLGYSTLPPTLRCATRGAITLSASFAGSLNASFEKALVIERRRPAAVKTDYCFEYAVESHLRFEADELIDF